jgi:hypothetical protein
METIVTFFISVFVTKIFRRCRRKKKKLGAGLVHNPCFFLERYEILDELARFSRPADNGGDKTDLSDSPGLIFIDL